MFDDDKRRYVDEVYPGKSSGHSRYSVLSTLMLLNDYEIKWGSDFTLQTLSELQPAFNEVVSSTWYGANSTLQRLKKYAFWRKANGLPCGNDVFALCVDRSVVIRESMVASPEALAVLLNAVFDPPSMATTDIIYRVFLWMGYFGIDDRSAIRVEASDVDLKEGRIRMTSGEHIICPDAIDDFISACCLTTFARGHKQVARAEGNTIMRGFRRIDPDTMLVNTVRPTLARRLGAAAKANRVRSNPIPVGFDITFNRVFMSGLFYRLYEQERLRVRIDFARYAEEEFERAQASGKPYSVTSGNPKTAILLRLRKSIEADYAGWKQAFWP